MLVLRLYMHFCAFIKHQIALQVFDVYRFICQIEIAIVKNCAWAHNFMLPRFSKVIRILLAVNHDKEYSVWFHIVRSFPGGPLPGGPLPSADIILVFKLRAS